MPEAQLVAGIRIEQLFAGVTVVGLLGGGWAVFQFLVTFIRESKRKRSELFFKLQDYFLTSPDLGKLCDLIELDDASEIEKFDPDTREEMLAFLEELALIVNSGALKAAVVHYFFGYYIIKCWKNDAYWKGLRKNRDDPYWRLLRDFVEEMEKQEKLLIENPSGVAMSLRV